mmetsp:Transcript_1903/g.4861  ORF Transcript_1903/g.4861 Transcript_1903/m.4861 type:complete len:547 (-) Transcript_1903:112-1752(-)
MDDIFNKARKEAIKLKREAKRTLELETPLERNIREATSNENWGCANSILYDIAVAAQDYSDRQKIMKKIREFMDEKPHKWRRILKTLNLVDYLLKNGTDRTVDDCLGEQYTVRRLERFSYSEEGKDRGAAVRDKAKAISEMMGSKDALRQAREEAKAHREKFGGLHSNTVEGRTSKGSDSGGFRMEQSNISKSNFDAKFNELKKQKEEAGKNRDVRDVRYDRQQKKEGADAKSPRDTRERRAERDDRAEDRSEDRGAGRNRRRYDDDDDEEDHRRARSKTPDDDDDDFDFDQNSGSRNAGHGDLLDTGGDSLLEQGGSNNDFFAPNWQSAAVAPPAPLQQQQAQFPVMDLFSAPAAAAAQPRPPLEFAAPAAPAAPSAAGGDFEFGDFVGQPTGAPAQAPAVGFAGPPMSMPTPYPLQAPPSQPAAPMFGAPGPMGTSAPSGHTGAPPMGGYAGSMAGSAGPMGMQPMGVAMPSVAFGAQPAQTVPKDTFLGDVGGLCDLTIESAAKPDLSKGAGKGGQGTGIPPPTDANKTAQLDFGNPFAASGF